MPLLKTFAAVAIATFVGHSLAVPVVPHPSVANDLVLTPENTLSETNPYRNGPHRNGHKIPASSNSAEELSVSVYNNLQSDSMNAYVTGLDPNGILVCLTPGGSWFAPKANGSISGIIPQIITEDIAIPMGDYGTNTSFTIPSYVQSARIWFADGHLKFYTGLNATGYLTLVEPSPSNQHDPSANVNWGFVELTTNSDGLTVNLSYVDFVGLPLGIKVQGSNGTQTALGVPADAVSSICSALSAQASSDGQPWDKLCISDSSGNALRVIAPYDYIQQNPGAFASYWTRYISQVWAKYSTTPLTIDTQAAAGLVNCTTLGNSTLTCDGDNRPYERPSAGDIFGCNTGPFAIEETDNDVHRAVVPRLCAAFDRSTFLLRGGNVQPSLDSSHYYTTSPTDYYSKIVHEQEVDGRGYAFAYDDVNPPDDDGSNASGLLNDPDPSLLSITIGGPTS
ncbi:uncharacterized protein PFLUO_LOCUS2215 [Penicillium psychrofluorescens]|uniref:uncharacterized protein n=1 Tax=Penicillium psychrofluorescens TaxID=3158075 RepID=UPI003CCCF7BD